MGFNSLTGSFIGFHIHMLFGLIFFIGIVIAIVAIAKFSNKKDIYAWMTWLLIIGFVGLLLTNIFGGGMLRFMSGKYSLNRFPMMMNGYYDDEIKNYNSYGDWQQHMFEKAKESYNQ